MFSTFLYFFFESLLVFLFFSVIGLKFEKYYSRDDYYLIHDYLFISFDFKIDNSTLTVLTLTLARRGLGLLG